MKKVKPDKAGSNPEVRPVGGPIKPTGKPAFANALKDSGEPAKTGKRVGVKKDQVRKG